MKPIIKPITPLMNYTKSVGTQWLSINPHSGLDGISNIDDLSNPEHVQGLTYGYLSIK